LIKPFIEKLSHYMVLSEEEKQILENTTRQRMTIEKGDDIITQGQRPVYVHLIESGWACRYKLLDDGKIHTMAYLIPGDLSDGHITILDKMDHSIRALTPLKITRFSADEMINIMENHPRLARAFFWTTLVDEATLREWLVNMGTRSSELRVAHVLCELLLRSRIAGLSHDDSFDFPLTQEELGESMGISQVHTNRVLQKLRREGLISLESRRVIIHDWERMKAFSQFDPTYLHSKLDAV
jgi:CRP-like cAMP-binding protein